MTVNRRTFLKGVIAAVTLASSGAGLAVEFLPEAPLLIRDSGWTINGGIITQSGITHGLTGLGKLPGVKTSIVNGVSQYDIGSNMIKITGEFHWFEDEAVLYKGEFQ